MESNYITIALDGMGGDFGPPVVVPAAIEAIKRHNNLKLIITGDETLLQSELQAFPAELTQHISLHHTTQKVASDESPSSALRNKKDSSLRVAIDLVKQNKAQACVSAGNTGALMATARFVLKMLPGIDRPAICTALPTMTGHTHVLDLGANVDSSAESLFEFAVMGSALVQAVDNIERPTVGLLNIGEEEIKGNERVKEAARLLSESELNYIGYIEGDGIYQGVADVVVCDGFVGNVMLKTSEGVAKMISHYMKQAFYKNILTKITGLIAKPVLKQFRKKIDPREYNGASLLGLQGIVVKSHGSADEFSFAHAINQSILEVEKNVPSLIVSILETHLSERQVG